MTIQVFVDDSGSKGHSRHFVLAGLIGFSESWQDFSKEWASCLAQTPAVQIFKMKEAASRSGYFRGVSEADRDAKLKQLARIINRHAQITTYSAIDLDAHAQTWGKAPRPHRDPFFWPFQTTIAAACHTLWDAGWREKFEIVFDEHAIFGPRAKHWYPVTKRVFEHMYPKQSTLLPHEPLFASDDVCLPIQAADLFAWRRRKATDQEGTIKFEWLLNEMGDVQETDYSQYYDIARMRAVSDDALRLAGEGAVPSDIVSLYQEMQASMKHR